MKTKVFISRNLTPDSVLHQLLGVQFVDRYLIEYKSIPFDFNKIKECLWLFFYSKKSIDFFVTQLNDDLEIRSFNVICIGKKTAEHFEIKTGLTVQFIVKDFHDDDVITKLIGQDKICFIQGKFSFERFQSSLPERQIEQCIVYDNTRFLDSIIPACDYYIFTSPRNTLSFFTHQILPPHAIILSIGSSTTNELQKHYKGKIHQSQSASEESLKQLLDSFIL